MSAWNKVHVFEGDPAYIHHSIQFVKEDLNDPEIIRYSGNSSADEIKSALTAFPFFEVPNLIVISEPNADILKMCLALAESDFAASGLIVTCEHNNFDSRLSFISKAAKNKRITYFEPLQGNDIIKYVKDWISETGIRLTSDCYSWFEKNGPTVISKIKTPTGKKDIIVYDLLTLDKFLNKLEVVFKYNNETLSLKDLINLSNFNRESDTWIFIDNIIANKLTEVFEYFNKNKLSLSNHSILWLIASQFEFLVQIKSALEKTKNTNEISDILSLKKMVGYYLNDNMETISEAKSKAAVNPYRLQMAIQTCNNVAMDDLINKYHATISAIRDIRSGMDPDLVSLNLSFAYSNKKQYLDPILDV